MPTTALIALSLYSGVGSRDLVQASTASTGNGDEDVTRLNDGLGCLVGTQLEHPHTLEILFTWDSSEHRMTPNDLGSIAQRFGAARPSEHSVHNVDFRPFHDFGEAALAPVTEVARFYFEGDPGLDVLTGFYAFRDVLQEHKVTGLLGFAVGLTHEEVEHGGNKGKIAVLLMGWTSVNAHETFQKTQLFHDSVHLLPIKEARSIEVHHTSFRQQIAE